jgi:hypothetical protein
MTFGMEPGIARERDTHVGQDEVERGACDRHPPIEGVILGIAHRNAHDEWLPGLLDQAIDAEGWLAGVARAVTIGIFLSRVKDARANIASIPCPIAVIIGL